MENADTGRDPGIPERPIRSTTPIDLSADAQERTEAIPAAMAPSSEMGYRPQPASLQQPAANADASADILRSDATRRQQVESELRQLGMSPVEIQRFLAADAHVADGASPKAPSAPPAGVGPTAKTRSSRPDAAALQSFAADLLAARTAEQNRAVESASGSLPAFRNPTPQERIQADSMLREANMLRRRERYTDAEAKCREAIALVPKDAAALEMLGDVCQGLARIEPALAAYKRAMEADAKRSSAEKKYGDLLMRQQNWGGYDGEAVEKNPYFSVFLSAMLPGAGQIHNGDFGKGAFFLILDALCGYLLGWSKFGFSGKHTHQGLDAALMGCVVLSGCLYIMAVWDANVSARRGRRRDP